MFKLHRGYSIPASVDVTKKLTQQYIGPFQIVEKVGRLAYRLKISSNRRIYLVFSMAQLEPTPSPSEDPFYHLCPQQPPFVFVEDDTDKSKSFEIDQLLHE